MKTSEYTTLVLGVGTLLPLLTSVVQQPRWSPRVRAIIGVVVSIIAGLVTYVSVHGLNFSSAPAIESTVIGVVLASVTAYHGIWQPTGIAPAIESATSPSNSTPPAVSPRSNAIPDADAPTQVEPAMPTADPVPSVTTDTPVGSDVDQPSSLFIPTDAEPTPEVPIVATAITAPVAAAPVAAAPVGATAPVQ